MYCEAGKFSMENLEKYLAMNYKPSSTQQRHTTLLHQFTDKR